MTAAQGDAATGAPLARPPAWRVAPMREVALRDGGRALLRPLTPADADAMAAFFAALSARDVYYFFHLDEAGARALALDAERAPAYRLVAVDGAAADGRILGYAFLYWGSEEAPTFGVCLRSDAQSRGLGAALVDHLLGSASDSGVRRARLTVHPDNGRALRLYQRAGFRIVGEFVNQHQGAKQYRMEADLSAARPAILEGLAIVPLGGIGVGTAAAEVQTAIARNTGRLPLVLDRPARPRSPAIFVADLAVPGPRWGPGDGGRPDGADWIVSLDEAHVLIGGVGVAALARACRRYAELLAASQPRGPEPVDPAAVSMQELITPGGVYLRSRGMGP